MKLINILKEITIQSITPNMVIGLTKQVAALGLLAPNDYNNPFGTFMEQMAEKYKNNNSSSKYIADILNQEELTTAYLILLKMKKDNSLQEINFKRTAAALGMAAGSMLPLDINKNTEVPQSNVALKKDKEETSNISLNDFLKALHQVETGGQTGSIIGDNGRALGPFQIHKIYWSEVAPQIGGRYQDVSNLDYAKKVVIAYFLKYAKDALKNKDWETLAKIHNGGPRGAKKKSTEKYWQKVKAHL
jgi:hypothetical protein